MSQGLVAQIRAEMRRRRALSRLERECRKYGLTNRAIAAACEPRVNESLVSHVFAGRAKSSRVEAVARRLIEERRRAA